MKCSLWLTTLLCKWDDLIAVSAIHFKKIFIEVVVPYFYRGSLGLGLGNHRENLK